MEEAKTRNGSMEGIQDNLGMLEGGSGSGAGGERKDERTGCTITTNSWVVASAGCLLGASRVLTMAQALQSFQNIRHIFMFQKPCIYIYTQMFGEST